MTSLFDVGKSAIQAYRQSLAVTGQNIANMNTEGYKRREADLQEVTASQGGITSLADQTGLGVRVADIRRSFDAFLLDRARSSTANFQRMDSYVTQLRQLEDMLLPSDADLGTQIGRFFESLGDVAAAPGDLAPRVVALEEGNALAASFNATAQILTQQKAGTLSRLDDAVSALTLLGQELASINGRILSAGQSGQSPNSLFDLRDRVIGDIADLTDITVTYEDRGVANVTLGSSGVGPSLVAQTEATSIGYLERSGAIQVVLRPGAANSPTSQVTSGIVSGLADAYALISEVQKDVDHLAMLVGTMMNKQHMAGVDLDGNAGREMFSAKGLVFQPNLANGSALAVEIDVTDVAQIPQTDMSVSYNGASGLWTLTGGGLPAPLTGTDMITGPGFTVRINATPRDGDSFVIAPQGNAAAAMKFMLTRPQEFAAASASLVAADTKNLGTADLVVQTGMDAETVVNRPIGDVMLNSQSPVEATEFMRNGLVATVPAGTRDISLASFAKQASARFELATGELAGATQMRFALDGTGNDGPHVINISRAAAYPNDISGKVWDDVGEIAGLLNAGVLRTTSGDTLADLGLHVSGAGTSMTISTARGNFARTGADVAQITTAMGTSLAVLNDAVAASDIQIFTREGRHIAGTPLDNIELGALMNKANGFTDGAVYNGAYLNQQDGAYRGMTLNVSHQGGFYQVNAGGNGTGPVALGGVSVVPANSPRDHDISVTLDDGSVRTVTLKAGATAGEAAKQINQALADNGILARGSLRVELSGFSAAGTVSFDLESVNKTPIKISAAISSDNLEPLARAINNETTNTGVTAVLSGNGKRLILETSDGEDMVFSALGVASPQFSSKVLNSDGSDATSPLVLGSTAADGRIDTARFSGVLSLTSGDNFSFDGGNGAIAAVKDPLVGGFVAVTGNASDDTKQITFEVNSDSIGNGASLDGLRAVVANGAYSLALPTSDSSIRFAAAVQAVDLPDLSVSAVNRALVSDLRAQGPLASFSGTAVSPLPETEASVSIAFGGDYYQLTMQDGDIVVSGGEPGRVTAYFDAAGALQIFGGGTVGGQTITLAPDSAVSNNANNASLFGINNSTTRLSGQTITLAGGMPNLTVTFNDAAVDIALAANGAVTKTPNVAGLTARWQEMLDANGNPTGTGRLILEYNSASNNLTMSRPADRLGFKTADASLRLTDGGIQAKSLSGDVIKIEADASGLASQTITMSDLPYEDLLILVTGGGARAMGAVYSEGGGVPARAPLTVKVSDENSSTIDIIDSETGHSIATRLLDQDGFAHFEDYLFELRGNAKKDDIFTISQNVNATGDARNISLLLSLQTADVNGTNSGGFRNVFNSIVAEVGAAVRSGDISLDAAVATRDAAIEAESEFSGVNLDSEAAALLEYQQAYQASARILSTARELFQSLIDVV